MAENLHSEESVTTVDGVRAIEMRYRAIRSTDSQEMEFWQTSMRLNSPSQGVILPEKFMPVLECDDRCVAVFKLALMQALKAEEKFEDREYNADWISVTMPLRLLRKENCVDICKDIANKCNFSTKKICIEFPSILLDETDGECSLGVKRLRSAGFRTMITGVGGNNFPLIRLAPFEFDYVCISDEVTDMLDEETDRADACVESVVSFINNLDAEPVACGVSNEKQAKKLNEMECSYYTGAYSFKGEFAGNYLLERYIRRKE